MMTHPPSPLGCSKKWQALKMNSATGCYKLFDEELPWEEAEQKCQKENSHLASVASDDEQTMLVQVTHPYFYLFMEDHLMNC